MDFPAWTWWAVAIGLFLLIEALMAIWYIRRLSRQRVETTAALKEVQHTGEPGSALVLEATDTGKRLGAYSFLVVRLRLRVTRANGEEFETAIDAHISPVRIADFAEGKHIKVSIDPHARTVVLNQPVQ
ncbi:MULTISPECIES: DUF4381 family protein [Brucella]|nr:MULTISPECIES: DUF4381 family protein [Brucella]ERU04891.1 hypothetical protein P039_02150 [Brucella abortus 07-0994-2411]KEY02686.1 hypothetical protein IL60_0203130 [Brucella inopinata BO1]AHZ82434.1 hypothetical protein DA85_11275 [Brucella canis]AIJ56394.1 hypothetical protein DK51_2466 [Brucella abortus]AIJ69460.1 hypothetical protein DK67_2184 [Brucella suis bv. 3 str. 686]